MLRIKLLGISRLYKKIVMVLSDLAVIWLGLVLSFTIGIGWNGISDFTRDFVTLSLLLPCMLIPINTCFGLYHAVLRYLNPHVGLTLLKIGFLSGVCMGGGLLRTRARPSGQCDVFIWCYGCLVIGALTVHRSLLAGWALFEGYFLAIGECQRDGGLP